MYNKEHFDHLFYRIKKNVPKSQSLFLLVTVIKWYPLFLLIHTVGFIVPPDGLYSIHSYFRYFCLTYYIQSSFNGGSTWVISVLVLAINLLCVCGLLYYWGISRKVKKLDENYGTTSSSLGFIFKFFSVFIFFKYIILFQFFIEINFLPLICLTSQIDLEKINENNIFGTGGFDTTGWCNGNNWYIFLVSSALNLIIDIGYYWVITSRFFDFNILSNYKWNFYPNLIFSFEFWESTTQLFFIPFWNYKNTTYKIGFNFYVLFMFLVDMYKKINKNDFSTANTTVMVYIAEYCRAMAYFSCVFIAVFQFGFDAIPNDVNIIGLIIFEVIFVFLLLQFFHRNDQTYIKNVLVKSWSHLNEKNIYNTLIFLIKEFKKFSDIACKFSDSNLDLFLETYVNHLKICDDMHCPCKNYVKKVNGASNTIKSGYTTVINFTHMKKDQQEEYILNKFFNVLAANINQTIKYTNNVNLNNIKDSQRQKLIYQLRLKLITAVKKLISYKLEKLTREIDRSWNTQFKKETKDFIRINFYAVNILCNKSYYKTQFLYYEFLADYFKRNDTSYHFNMIYYWYLKMFSIQEYNEHISTLKQVKKEHSGSGFHLDFRTVLSLCVKYYEIEERLINTAKDYEKFILYFTTDKIIFDKWLDCIKKFKGKYKSVTQYIGYFFKNDKINNWFVCTKIILFFKILHFDIPETWHNKLIIQVHETDDNNKMHSYIDSNYYMILNYLHGEFVIKFISHELLIVLEYSEDDLRDADFHVLMPEKMRRWHNNVIIGEIKSRAMQGNAKEIFWVSKKQTCVWFDIQYKFLLNLKGEITLLTVVNLKKPNKDVRICFASIDDHGDVLALNKEFEEYFVLSMKIWEYVKIDTEKLILHRMGVRMRNFFKDEENTEFQEQFDYEQFWGSLFDEEFEIWKEKNEKEYRKKYARWEVWKEMNRKGRYYTRYIELNIKQRILGSEKIYFLKYSVKLTLSLRSIEPHSTTLSWIHAVKISKREMAKLSFYRGEEWYECKSEKSWNEEKIESHDDLLESQSMISSAISQLKERNSVRLFKQKRNTFKFLPKSRNIWILMISIGVWSIITIVYNIIILIIKTNMYKTTQKFLLLDWSSMFFQKNLLTISAGVTVLNLFESKIIKESTDNPMPTGHDLSSNWQRLLNEESLSMNNVSYHLSYISSQNFKKSIDELISKTDELIYIFDNGLIYKRDNTIWFEEIVNWKKMSLDVLNKYNDDSADLPESSSSTTMYDYYFLQEIKKIQQNWPTSIKLNNQDMEIFFVMNNLYSSLLKYSEALACEYNKQLISYKNKTLKNIIIIKIVELILIFLIVAIEWMFIYFGYEKSKKKMISLRHKVERNNIDFTLKKVDEFIHFSNNFNINSLYYIADWDLKKVDESGKTVDASNTNSKTCSTLLSTVNATPRKKNWTNQILGNRDDSFNNSVTNSNWNADSLNWKEDLKTNTTKNFNELPMSNFSIQKNETDGKRNLLKVMDRWTQIKGIKKSKLEKKGSERSNKSGQSNNSNDNYNTESANNLGGIKDNSEKTSEINESDPNLNNKIKNEVIPKISFKAPEENENENDNEEDRGLQARKLITTEPVKSALRTVSNKNWMNMRSGGEDLNSISNNGSSNNIGNAWIQEEDPKFVMLNNHNNPPETLGLANKPTRTTKVQFQSKERNVLYYQPGLTINEASEVNNQMKSNKMERKGIESKDGACGDLGQGSSQTKTNTNNIMTSNHEDKNFRPSNNLINGHNKTQDRTWLSEIQSSSNIIPNRQHSKSKLDLKPSTKQRQVNLNSKNMANDLQLHDLKENQWHKYQLIEQGRAVTVKKRQEINEKDPSRRAEIEDKLENVIHNNTMARAILNIALIIFSVLYLSSIIFNFVYDSRISNASEYANLLLNKTNLINTVVLRYQFDVIEDNYDDILAEYITKTQINNQDLIDFEVGGNPKVLPKVYSLTTYLKTNSSCDYLSKEYSSTFSTIYEDESYECENIGDWINTNGIANAENYILSTMITWLEDWKNLHSEDSGSSWEKATIIAKWQDPKYFNILLDTQYSMRKACQLIINYIMSDTEQIFEQILINEEIYGYSSIIWNLLFLALSLIFIIYPIKYVEMIISWLIHKIMKG